MQAVRFKRWIDGLALLSEGQRRQLLERLRPALGLDRLRAAIEPATPSRLACPGCGGERYHRHGRDRGLQRYRCRGCGSGSAAAAAARPSAP